MTGLPQPATTPTRWWTRPRGRRPAAAPISHRTARQRTVAGPRQQRSSTVVIQWPGARRWRSQVEPPSSRWRRDADRRDQSLAVADSRRAGVPGPSPAGARAWHRDVRSRARLLPLNSALPRSCQGGGHRTARHAGPAAGPQGARHRLSRQDNRPSPQEAPCSSPWSSWPPSWPVWRSSVPPASSCGVDGHRRHDPVDDADFVDDRGAVGADHHREACADPSLQRSTGVSGPSRRAGAAVLAAASTT
jgi:hypothetical protein